MPLAGTITARSLPVESCCCIRSRLQFSTLATTEDQDSSSVFVSKTTSALDKLQSKRREVLRICGHISQQNPPLTSLKFFASLIFPLVIHIFNASTCPHLRAVPMPRKELTKNGKNIGGMGDVDRTCMAVRLAHAINLEVKNSTR